MGHRWRWSVVLRTAGWLLIGFLAVRGTTTLDPQVGWYVLAGGIIALGYGGYQRGIEEMHAESERRLSES